MNKISTYMIGLLVATMLLSGPVAARGAYKWVDENGTVHYSDRLQGDDAEVINVVIQEPEAEASSVGEAESADSKQQAKADDKNQVKEKQQREENCTKARQQLKRNENLGRMYRVEANGERHYLTDKERGDILKQSLDAIEYWCD